VGTTITAILGAISASVSGRRLAVAHLIFNLVTASIAIIFIKQFAVTVDWLSQLVGIAADDHTLKFAVFHTLFNLVGVALMLPFIGALVTLLERLLHEKVEPLETTRVLFLNKSALEFPDTALEVISRETVHMASNAFEILAHGLNLHRSDITSNADINAVLARCTDTMTIDVDDLYRRKVKPLYSAIIDFSTQAEQHMDARQLERLTHLKRANWQIVTTIKHIKEMQANIDRYMCADNKYVRREYNAIRLNIAILLRTLFTIEAQVSPAAKIEQLTRIRLEMEEQDIIANGALDKLIREQRITSDMATSLMNDSSFAYQIQRNLISAAEIIFANLYSQEKDLSLTEEDVEKEMLGKREEIMVRLSQEKAQIDNISTQLDTGAE
jgi:phosphate:Na+ symporter